MAKTSPTQRTKSKKPKTKTVSLRRLQQVLCPVTTAGAVLANVAFNLKQRKDLPIDIRESLEECQKAWDLAIRRVPNHWRI
jgi:hypothetical protein